MDDTIPAAKAEILNPVNVSTTFPDLPNPLVLRDRFLNEIERLLGTAIEAVTIRGEEGVGKTVLLAQFAKRNPENTISLFIKPGTLLGDDLDYLLYDLANQIKVILDKRELESDTPVEQRFVHTQVGRLRKLARRTTFYFVVDGLDEIPEDKRYVAEQILDVLPLGVNNMRFVFSGELSGLLDRFSRRLKTEPLRLLPFDKHETSALFNDYRIPDETVDEILRLTQGKPDLLWSIRRNLLRGIPIDSIIDQIRSGDSDLFNLEWSRVDPDDGILVRSLALLAHSESELNLAQLCRILNVTESDLRHRLRALGFVHVEPDSPAVRFLSDPFRRFVARKLAGLRKEAIDLLIKDLLDYPDEHQSVTYLPDYLLQEARYDQLLAHVEKALPDAAQRFESWTVIRNLVMKGLQAAEARREYVPLLEYSLAYSALVDIAQVHPLRSEIEARLALGDIENARRMAQTAPLKVDRLHLLAIVAKGIREAGMVPEPEILDEIRLLYEDLEPEALGSRVADIAGDLLHSVPELAFDLLERGVARSGDDNALDWALVGLTLQSLLSQQRRKASSAVYEVIRDRIRDPGVQRFASAAAVIVGEYSGSEVIRECEGIEEIGARLFLLQKWCLVNRKHADAADVMEYGLDMVIKNSGYAPNLKVLRELAEPLPFIEDEERLARLILRFDGQIRALSDHAPTEEYVKLQLLLGRGEARMKREERRDRLVNLYYFVSEVSDVQICAECLALILAAMPQIDSDGSIDGTEQLSQVLEVDLRSRVRELLLGTAEHDLVMKGVIDALACRRSELALEFAASLNTVRRRDAAFRTMIDALLPGADCREDWQMVIDALGRIWSVTTRDRCVMEIASEVHRRARNRANPVDCDTAMELAQHICEIRDAETRCDALACLVAALTSEGDASFVDRLVGELRNSLEAIDGGAQKIATAFRIASRLAASQRKYATEFLCYGDRARSITTLDSEAVEKIYLLALSLVVRSFAALVRAQVDQKEDEIRLEKLIGEVPSLGLRAMIWADIAVSYHLCDRAADCERIVTRYVLRLLDEMPEGDRGFRDLVIAYVAPALYVTHQEIAYRYIESLPESIRDAGYVNVADFLFLKRILFDPVTTLPRQAYRLDYPRILDLCSILDRLDEDLYITAVISHLTDSMRCRRSEITSQQRIGVLERLYQIIRDKLPNERYIQHAGYVLYSLAMLAQVDHNANWGRVIEEARSIPNLADRTLVIATIAAALPAGRREFRRSLLIEARDSSVRLPSVLDRVSRLLTVAESAMDIDPQFAQDCLKTAFESIAGMDSPDIGAIRRRLIDSAVKVDLDFASSLSSLLDTDPVRRRQKLVVEERIRVHRLARKLANVKERISEDELHPSVLSQAAWMNLGLLNASAITPISIDRLLPVLSSVASAGIYESYPVFSWIIQNEASRLRTQRDAERVFRPQFESLVKTARLVYTICARLSGRLRQIQVKVSPPEIRSRLVPAGKRDLGISFVEEWLSGNLGEYLKICDPYFGPDDLDVLRLILTHRPDCSVYILTSEHGQRGLKLGEPVEDIYRDKWYREISAQMPPETCITIVGVGPIGKLPVHDRWWVTTAGGLAFGTSWNGLGRTRDSEIRILSQAEAAERESVIDDYISGPARLPTGEKVNRRSFWLR